MENITRDNGRKYISLDKGWKFHLGDIKIEQIYWGLMKNGICNQGGSRAGLDDSKWRNVNLPHDFVVEGTMSRRDDTGCIEHGLPEIWNPGPLYNYHGSYETDIAWYRKRFAISGEDAGKRAYLWFDGIYRDSQIYLNDCFVKNHKSGYTGIIVDVTDFLYENRDNLLAIRVDAKKPEGWFYEGGGIYRHARILFVSPVHVAPMGVFAYACFDNEDPGQCEITVETEVSNGYAHSVDCILKTELLSPSGSVAASDEMECRIGAAYKNSVKQRFIVHKPLLWDMDTPHLYTVKTSVILDKNEVDLHIQTFGIRNAKFDSNKGFILNGRQVKIKGMCCHQDHAGVGTAIPEELWEYRVDKLLELGCNSLRTAHNPPAPELIDICDRKGLLVMAENRLLSSAPEYMEQLEFLLKAYRNNPSVILWSLGNEEQGVQKTEIGKKTAAALRELAHRLDPTRPVTMAIHLPNLYHAEKEGIGSILPIARELDVMGFNYASDEWADFHKAMPEKPVVVTEDISKGATRGCYITEDIKAHSASSYEDHANSIFQVADSWKLIAENGFLSGYYIWTGFDYRGEPFPYQWPAVASQFGVMDSCGFPKDIYWYFKSIWSRQPVVRLTPHWNWDGQEDKFKSVCCYTNCEEAELFVNGKSMGLKKCPEYSTVLWDSIKYEAGSIEAVGYIGGQKAAGHRVETTGAPYAVRLSALSRGKCICTEKAIIVNVEVVDSKGRVVPYAGNEISFMVEGQGTFIAAGNGNPSSHEADYEPRRYAFNGMCQIIARAGEETGEMKITAHSSGLYPDSLVFEIR